MTDDEQHKPGFSIDTASLVGQLVEIHDLEAPLEPCLDDQPQLLKAKSAGFDANGQKGRALGWDEAEKKYIIETFDGVILGAPGQNVRLYEPPGPEDGGFDVAWPSGPEDPEVFAEMVVSCLADKGYCLIQMFTPPEIREGASEESRDLAEWRLPAKELEVPYLGYDNSSKYSSLPDDSLQREPITALSKCDRTLTSLGLQITPFLESYFDFKVWGRRKGMVCVPLAGQMEENLLRPRGLEQEDYEPGGLAYGHVNFLERRKLQVMYMIHNEGGHIWLYPNANLRLNLTNVRLPLTENKLLVILPDIMSYSYKPVGENLLLQTWYVSPPVVADPQDRRVVTLPELHQRHRAMVMSLAMRFSADAHGPESGRLMWLAGTDGSVRVPQNRFDIDAYYSPEMYQAPLYTKHGGCMNDEVMLGFDNAFFGIAPEEAGVMDPSQRQILETGYEALQSAGYDKASLRGHPCAVYLGDAGTDWVLGAVTSILNESAAHGVMNPHIRTGCNGGVNCSRLSFLLSLRGPCSSADTACSSSLVCFGQAHRTVNDSLPDQAGCTADNRVKQALVMGTCMLDGLPTFMAYCAATMLSIGGRSFTFDESANGFVRAEGCGALLLKRGDSEEDAQGMRACGIGANVNQDGRSASMTAPNGPSQSTCIRNCMREAGLSPNNITIAECHGTGTALGDPIEVGALREVMKDRSTPMMVTSTKSNFGHMEANAGMGGLAKCITMLTGGCGTANVHLKCINPHIEFSGYPALFLPETQDTRVTTGISGVSSFGVGGTNARADLWGRCLFGYHATTQVSTLQALRLKSLHYARLRASGSPGPGADDRVFVVGSWDGWAGMSEMEALGEGEYGLTVTLGETRRERFRLLLNRDPRQSLYPATDLSEDSLDICGPDWDAQGRGWLLDGREGGSSSSGSSYQIKLEWSFSWALGEHKRVLWEPVKPGTELEGPQLDSREHDHSYYVAGSWTAGRCRQMEPSAQDSGVHRTTVRVGVTGKEWFHILRDRDEAQTFHPAIAGAQQTRVPVKGPDNKGKGKYWVIHAPTGEHVTVEFQIVDGTSFVTLRSPSQGVLTWTSVDKDDWHELYISRKQLESALVPMSRASGGRLYTGVVVLGSSSEQFQLVLDRDPQQVLYPHRGQAGLGEGAVCGPNNEGAGLYWQLRGRPGDAFEVALNMDEEDPLQAVSWRRTDSNLELTDAS